jgi:hypothetical protein
MHAHSHAHMCTHMHGAPDRVRTDARTTSKIHARLKYTRPQGWTDGLDASARTHMHTYSIALRTKQTAPPPPLALPPRRGAWALATRRLCRTPAKWLPPVRPASPPPQTTPAPVCRRTGERNRLIRPPAILPATLPHALLPTAPPVSWQEFTPHGLGPHLHTRPSALPAPS